MIFRSHGGFATNVCLTDLYRDDVVLARSWDGRPSVGVMVFRSYLLFRT